MRLAVITADRLDPFFGWFTLGPPLLKALSNRDDAFLVSPPPLAWAHGGSWPRAIREIRDADTLFWCQSAARPELPIWLLGAAAPRARRSAYVLDPWRSKISRIGILAVMQRFDPCFVAFREAYEELTHRFPRGRFEWLPCGVDVDAFKPASGKRDIFAYWMGRRFEPLHRALMRYCNERGLQYRFTEQAETPKFGESGELASRSLYFVVTPPDLDNPVRTGGFSPLVMRYLEGLSAGARLLGVLPRSGEYDLLLPRDAILEVSPDGKDLVEKLDADAASGGAFDAVERARDLVRRQHSWARRAEQIHARLTTGSFSI